MVLDDNDVLSITVEQELLGEDLINIFYYVWEAVNFGVTLLDILTDFKDDVWDAIRAGMNPDLSAVNFVGRNLTNGLDIDNLVGPVNGLDITGGDVSPSYVAAGYSLLVGSLETRPGSKRFAGTSEQRVNDNDYIAGGTVSADIETLLAARITVSGLLIGDGDIVPYIVGRDLLGALDLTRIQPVQAAQVSSTIRSQTSRRVG